MKISLVQALVKTLFITLLAVVPVGSAFGALAVSPLQPTATNTQIVNPIPVQVSPGLSYGGLLSYDLTGTSNSITIGDFNNDTQADVALLTDTSIETGKIVLFYGAKNGLVRSSMINLEGRPRGINQGDFNGDGKLDLMVNLGKGWPPTNYCKIYFGAGNGTFPTSKETANQYAEYAQVNDLNRDGKADLLYLAYGGSTYYGNYAIGVQLGNGDGTFQEEQTSEFTAGQLLYTFTSGDFNNDNKLDLVVVYKESTNPLDLMNQSFKYYLIVLTGNGSGSFTAGTPIENPHSIEGIVTGDFNNDGKADLVTYNPYTISTRRGNGNGTFQSPSYLNFDADQLYCADFNGDSKLDLAATRQALNTVAILQNKGDGTFQEATSYKMYGDPVVINLGPLGTSIPSAFRLSIGDINGDQRADLVSLSSALYNKLTVILSNSGSTSIGTILKPTAVTKLITTLVPPKAAPAKNPKALISNRIIQDLISNANLGSQNLKAVPGINSITLSWNADNASNLIGYNLYRAVLPGTAYTLINTAPITGTTYKDLTVKAGLKYSYLVTPVYMGPATNKVTAGPYAPAKTPVTTTRR